MVEQVSNVSDDQNIGDAGEVAVVDPYLEHQRSEKVLIVDAENNPVGSATRREMREGCLWHRASYVFIITDEAHGSKLLV